MRSGFRFDTFQLRPSWKRPDGALVCEALVAKPGILTYHLDDGSTRRELVTEDTLTRERDLETLGFAYVTDQHPPKPVTTRNADEHSVGATGEIVDGSRSSGLVRVRLVLQDDEAIEAAESGDRDEVSPGYKVKTEEDGGRHDEFGEYDAVQVAREYNHLAICKEARAGSDVRLRADSRGGGFWQGFRTDDVESVGIMDPEKDDDSDTSNSRDDGHGTNWTLRDAIDLAMKFAEGKGLERGDAIERIADEVGEAKATALLTIRGDFEPSEAYLRAISDVTGFPLEILQDAKRAGERTDAFADMDPEDVISLFADFAGGELPDDSPETPEGGGEDRTDATVNDPGDLPLAPLDRDWDQQRATESLYRLYGVDPNEDSPPDAWHGNYVYVQDDAEGSFTEGHNYLIVEAIDGERHIVPAALEAAQSFLQSNPGIPSELVSDVRDVIGRHWRRAWNKYGDDWIAPEPVWDREGDDEGTQDSDNSNGSDRNDSEGDMFDRIESALDDLEQRLRADQEGEGIELPSELEDVRDTIRELKQQKEELESEISAKRQQIKTLLEEVDPSMLKPSGESETEGSESGPESGGMENPDMGGDERDRTEGNNDSRGFDSEQERIDWHNERRELEAFADRLNLDADVRSMTNTEIKRAIAGEYRDDSEVEGMDETAVDATYEAIREIEKRRDDAYEDLSDDLEDRRDSGGVRRDEVRKAEQDLEDRLANAWKD